MGASLRPTLAPRARQAPAVLDGLAIGPVLCWCLCVFMFGLLVLLASLSAATGTRWSAPWHEAFATAACLLLLPLPFFVVHRLAAQWRVWQCRLAPLASWQEAVGRHLRMLLIAWGLVALPLLMLLGLTGGSDPGRSATALLLLSAPALLGAVLGLGLLAAAGWAGMLAWPWGLAGGLALGGVPASGIAPLMALSTAIEAVSHASSAAGLVGSVGLLGLMLSTAPLAVALLRGRLGRGAPAVDERAPAVLIRSAWRGVTERWRGIDARHGLPVVLIGILWPHLPAHWTVIGREFSLMGLFWLWSLTLLALFALRGGWPHWRIMLAPGGHFRRRIGLRIVLATWLSMCLLTAAVAAALVVLSLLLPFLPAPP